MPFNNWYPGKWYLEMIEEIFRLVAWPFRALFRLGKWVWLRYARNRNCQNYRSRNFQKFLSTSRQRCITSFRFALKFLTLFELIVVGFLTLKYCEYFPDVFGINSPTALEALFTNIAVVLAALLGITIAVLLIAFEAVKKVFSRYGYSIVLENRHFISMLTLYISVIFVSVLLAAKVDTLDPILLVAVSDISLLLFLVCLIGLVSECRGILHDTRPATRLEALVSAISPKVIRQFMSPRGRPTGNKGDDVPDNPLIVLREAINSLIRYDESVHAQLALAKIARRYPVLLSSDKTGYRDITLAILPILNSTITEAVRCNDMRAFQAAIDCMKSMHYHLSLLKADCHKISELNDCIVSTIRKHIASGRKDLKRAGPSVICNIWRLHLEANAARRTPGPTEEGFNIDDKDFLADYLQWEYIKTSFPDLLFGLLSEALTNTNEWAIKDGLKGLADLVQMIDQARDIPTEAKNDVILYAMNQTSSFLKECLEQQPKILEGLRHSHPFSYLTINCMLEHEKPYAKRAYQQMGQYIVDTAKYSTVNYMMINDIGIVGGSAAAHTLNSDFQNEVVQYSVTLLERISTVLNPESDEHTEFLYQETGRQIRSIYDSVDESGAGELLLQEIGDTLKRLFPEGVKEHSFFESTDDWPKSLRSD